MSFFVHLLCILIASLCSLHASDVATLEHTKASLISFIKNPEPGETFPVALVLDLKKEWHTYWDNPGDSGLKTEISWDLPKGVTTGRIKATNPKRLTSDGLTSYVHENRAIYVTNVTLPKDMRPTDKVMLKLKAKWLVCKDACIPEEADLVLDLSLRGKEEKAEALHSNLLNEWKTNQSHSVEVPLSCEQTRNILTINLPQSLIPVLKEDIAHIYFLPHQQNAIKHSAEPSFDVHENHTDLKIALDKGGDLSKLSGLIIVESKKNEQKVYDVTLQSGALGTSLNSGNMGIFMVFLFAFLGGVILNAMPCVFPILSLKALSIAQYSSASTPSNNRAHGLAYTFGILASFLILAGTLIFIKQGGHTVGWGFQMQSPLFVMLMVYLLFLIGLNLSGYFEITWTIGERGQSFTEGHDLKASFFTGVLSTAVATPCTAPFMATVLGYALTSSNGVILFTMASLGLGLAFPFLLISFIPAMTRILPRPGMWMVTLKEFLAFPMYLSTVWLIWVLIQEIGVGGILYAGLGLILCVFSLWLKGKITFKREITNVFFTVFLIVITLSPLYLLLCTLSHYEKNQPQEMGQEFAKKYSKAMLDGLLREKKPVFVYVTAAWCMTCKINEFVIESQTTQKAFKEKGVTVLIADWTNSDPKITDFLESHGHKGVPLYVVYAPSGKVTLLPQLLTQNTVLNALEEK